MGDRGNIIIEGSDAFPTPVYFYSHWSGSDLDEVVREALSPMLRWDDPAYLSRIIFCKLVEGNESDSTGFGISSTIGGGENQIVRVNMGKQTVQAFDAAPVSFADFIKQ